jgi:chromate transporter
VHSDSGSESPARYAIYAPASQFSLRALSFEVCERISAGKKSMVLLEIFLSFAKLGAIAYGGGPAMLPLIQAEVVEGRGWVSADDFRSAIGAGFALPGPIAPKMAFWVGLQAGGLPGGILAVIGVLLPNLTAMFLLTRFFFHDMRDNPIISGAVKGAGIGVIGLLAYITYNQAMKAFVSGENTTWLNGLRAHPDWIIIALLAFALAMWRPTLMVPLIVLMSGVYGAFFIR